MKVLIWVGPSDKTATTPGFVLQQVRHDKDLSLLNGFGCRAQAKFCRPSSAIVTSPHEPNILDWDVNNRQTNTAGTRVKHWNVDNANLYHKRSLVFVCVSIGSLYIWNILLGYTTRTQSFKSMYIRFTLYIPAILTVLVLLWFFTRSSLNVKRIWGIFVNITRSSNEWMFQKFFTQGCGKTIKSTQVCTVSYAICMDVNNW